jgi:hypothetical protein
MAKYLIEVPHGADRAACYQAIQVFLQTGSHFLTHADWGCLDGEHKAWIIVDVNSREDALFILPPIFRPIAKITMLTHFEAIDLVGQVPFHNG